MSFITRLFNWFPQPSFQSRIKLRYFEDVLPVELDAINARRDALGMGYPDSKERPHIRPLESKKPDFKPSSERKTSRKLSPDPGKLFPSRSAFDEGDQPPAPPFKGEPVDPDNPDYDKTRPRPVPCTATGLAFSGGGIRSAAVCLGALQALHHNHRIDSFDYVSTVSGGGYIGSCLTAAMSQSGGRTFPFGSDVSDSAAVAHLRNYSNYLLPRGRSGIRNIIEAAVIILRGLLANVVLVLATLIGFALVTKIAFPNPSTLHEGNFLPRLLDGLHSRIPRVGTLFEWSPFGLTLWLLIGLIVVLIVWATLRSIPGLDAFTGDTRSLLLTLSRRLCITTIVVALLDVQPLAIEVLTHLYDNLDAERMLAVSNIHAAFGVLVAFGGTISILGSSLGHFLKTSQHATDWTTLLLRGATFLAVIVAALVLPGALWITYLYLSAWIINGWDIPASLALLTPPNWRIFQFLLGTMSSEIVRLYLSAFFVLAVVALSLQANGYSLHRFYRDRLSKAFLFNPTINIGTEPVPLDHLELSALRDAAGPYHIINTAMNVQGSTEANRRGRNADFFMFTRDFVGSDLTLFGPARESIVGTLDMETVDPRLDLATAMAISGAAVSANMGTDTIRLLSPTLALLNIRLGYWMRNPRDLAREPGFWGQVREWTSRLIEKFYLVLEMLNQIDEKSRNVYLSDGGHIENLGIYELLKRGCELIVVIDAEADPSMSFGSLIKLERYARIDLGVRIELPWEAIAQKTQAVSDSLARGEQLCSRGPHCAVGRIFYENGAEGIIVYFKSSLTGDEKDYIIDYKKRYPKFPHEATSDQFFSEEQFEVYRALGFHMVDGFFGGDDEFSCLSTDAGAADKDEAVAAIFAVLPAVA